MLKSTNIYLTQTDTTVGFLCSDYIKLAHIKQRPISKKILQEVDSFKTLKKYTTIPSKFKNLIRRSTKTTFIYPNTKSFRVVKDNSHLNFLKKFHILYSTSANESGANFDMNFAVEKCDVEVLTNKKYFESDASSIIKFGKTKYTKIR